MADLRPIDSTVYAAIVSLMATRNSPVCPDDPAIYRQLAHAPERVRAAIMRLVKSGHLEARGDGYLRRRGGG